MKLNVEKDVAVFMNIRHHNTLTVSADQECVGANCSEFVYPVIHFRQPNTRESERFDRFEAEGVTVWFDKRLETVPEVTLKMEHHVLRDSIRVEGLPIRPEITHIHL